MDDIRWQKPPRPWELSQDGEAVRLGARWVRLGDVAGYATEQVHDPNIIGHLFAVGLFMGLGSLFLIPVMADLVGPKFLVGEVLFIGLGISAVLELRGLNPIRLFRVDIQLANGETVPFVSTEEREAEALAATLALRLD